MLTARQFLVIVTALVESFILSAHYAVFMPFYPNVAREKGNTHFQIGAFFAISSVIGLFGSPLAGWLLKRGIPPKQMLIFGLVLSGVMLAAHGAYKDLFVDSEGFFYANVLTRLAHSVGPVAATTALYPIVAVEMAESRAVYLPLIEAAYNMGLMVWPSFGALMFDSLGYMFPFVSVSICAILMALVVVFLLPPTPKPCEDDSQKIGFDKIDLPLWFILLNIAVCYLIIGFNDITLATELKNQFGLSHTEIGCCFAVATVCYGVCMYLWGFVCSGVEGRYMCQSVGFVVSMVGLFLFGPCNLVGVEATLPLRLTGQALMGIGLSGLFTSSMLSGMDHLMRNLLLPDDVSTHGFFSGLLFFSLCLGYLTGHAGFAGILLDLIGYDLTVVILIITVALAVGTDTMNRLIMCGRAAALKKKREGYAQIEAESAHCNI